MATVNDEGNIVATYQFGSVTVRISDAAYAGASPEEIRRRQAAMWATARELYVKNAVRRQREKA